VCGRHSSADVGVNKNLLVVGSLLVVYDASATRQHYRHCDCSFQRMDNGRSMFQIMESTFLSDIPALSSVLTRH
jgi:hypothetical protein